MNLHAKQALFAQLVATLIQEAAAVGFEVTLGNAWRSPEEAARLAQTGAGIRNSLHTKRLAIDLNLFLNAVYLTDSADYAPLGSWWERQSTPEYTCVWGGRFARADGNHFSIEHDGVR